MRTDSATPVLQYLCMLLTCLLVVLAVCCACAYTAYCAYGLAWLRATGSCVPCMRLCLLSVIQMTAHWIVNPDDCKTASFHACRFLFSDSQVSLDHQHLWKRYAYTSCRCCCCLQCFLFCFLEFTVAAVPWSADVCYSTRGWFCFLSCAWPMNNHGPDRCHV